MNNDLVNGGGAQDEAVPVDKNFTEDGFIKWTGTFTAVEGATFTQWHVTVGNFSSNGDCTVIVYANGGGTPVVVAP